MTTAAAQHAHRWILTAPNGPFATGFCACGAVREDFRNTPAESLWAEGERQSIKASMAKGQANRSNFNRPLAAKPTELHVYRVGHQPRQPVLGRNQEAILRFLAANDKAVSWGIAQALGVSSVQTQETLRRMLKRGLLTRAPHPDVKGCYVYSMTKLDPAAELPPQGARSGAAYAQSAAAEMEGGEGLSR